jgi:hypothetical protein
VFVCQSPSFEGAFEYPAICGICLFLSYCFVTKLLESNPAQMRGCEGEGDGMVLSNLEGSFSPNISGIVWMSGESIRRSDVLFGSSKV